MANPLVDRKARFKAALTRAEITLKAWAAHEGVTAAHVHMVLSGVRQSAALVGKIEQFIVRHTPRRNQAA